MAEFVAPTELELREQIIADIASEYFIDPASIPPASFEQADANATAGALRTVYDYLEYVQLNALPDTILEPFTSRWSGIYGVPFLQATRAVGNASASGATPGAVLPQNAEFTRNDGTIFTSNTQAIAGTDGAITVALTAAEAGPDGNTEAAQALTLTNPPAGIPEQFLVAAAGLTGGAEAETQQEHTDRRVFRIQNTPGPGLSSDYVRWAREATPQVGLAYAYPVLFGAGTVGVFIRSDDRTSPVPAADVVARVQAYIDSVASGLAHVTVAAISIKSIDFTLSITPDTPAVRAAVEAEIDAYLFRSGKNDRASQTTLYLTDISAAIAAAQGITTFTLQVPAANIVVAASEYPVRGDMTYTV